MKLKLADGLSLPLDTVTQTIAIVAKRRAGKSYTMRRLVEQLFKAGQQVVLVDPKGDQWGIRSAADGKAPGLPIVILGGEHGDLKQLEPNSGEVVAKLVVEERVSVLLDLSTFRKHEVATFMTAFLENLYRLKAREEYRTPMMLVVDEADAIAPQKPQKGEERMLGAAEDIVRRGGQRGIGCVLVTQRSAVLNKNVLTQAQVLVALRTIAPQDLAAMDAWIQVHGEPGQRETLMESLPSLPVGDAWFWSPGWPTTDGIFKRVHVLPIETFDSGASPKPGEKRIEPKRAADVDLEALKRQMSATIEKAKADDPRELRKQIAELKAQLTRSSKQNNAAPQQNNAALTDADRALLKSVGERLNGMATELGAEAGTFLAGVEARAEAIVTAAMKDFEKKVLGAHDVRRREFERLLDNKGFQKILGKLATVQPKTHATHATGSRTHPAASQGRRVAPAAATSRPTSLVSTNGDGTLKAMHRAMLTALAQHPHGLTKKQILVHTGYASSGPVSTAFAELAREGYVASDGHRLQITDAGLTVLGAYEPLPLGDELRAWLLSGHKLSGMEKALLARICNAYPDAIRKGEVLEQAGYASSGPVSSAFAKLVAYNYVVPQGAALLKAAEELFS